MAKMVPAPIALFVYNRPTHTRQTVEALQKNSLSQESNLFVFSDGPKNESAKPNVTLVREYIRTITGFRSVSITEEPRNRGLALSIISGVNRLCEEFGEVIVLEDDLVTSPFFLKYMNDALALYRDVDKVMHVSGGAYPIRNPGTQASYFLRVPLCWGWGTWSRAWSSFSRDTALMKRFDRDMIRAFDFDGTYDYWAQLELNKSGRISTWFVFWYASVFLKGGLALFPRQPLVQNIGMDGSGVHCSTTENYNVKLGAGPLQLSFMEAQESIAAVRQHQEYFRSIRLPLWRRTIEMLLRTVKR